MEDVPERLCILLGSVARRCWEEPDLEDFLAWRGGTIEPWLQMILWSVARRVTWAAQGDTVGLRLPERRGQD